MKNLLFSFGVLFTLSGIPKARASFMPLHPKTVFPGVGTAAKFPAVGLQNPGVDCYKTRPAFRAKKGNFFSRLKWLLPDKGKNRDLAALFSIALGFLGVHRFYLGYPVQGTIQAAMTAIIVWSFAVFVASVASNWFAFVLAFILGSILILWLLVDFIRILTEDLKPKNNVYEK